ncbi:MAG: peptide chain release factor N(5)-glutamine methyltransferase [Janthinobacterium lividum]
MKTVGEARIWLKEKLKNLFSAEELPQLRFLIMHTITGLSQTQIHAFPEKELSDQQTAMLLLSVKKLETGMPVQYALGEADFFELKFKVDPSVLIPRPETEELVAWVLEQKRIWERVKDAKILDIGTGSGCIPVALKKNWPEAAVFGLDVSTEALHIAQKNALQNQVEIGFFKQDILNFYPIKEASAYSIIVSNPPYIVPSEQKLMQANVLDFEPHLALFVPEADPLLFYRAISDYAFSSLAAKGLLFFEINPKFHSAVLQLLQEKGFVEITVKQDFGGKIRMVRALKP